MTAELPAERPRSETDATTRGRRVSGLVVGASLAAAFGLGALALVVWQETRREEIDRHEILADVEAITKAIRSHDLRLWMQIEMHPPSDGADPSLEAGHQRMLSDLERLSHLEEFRMKDVTVHVDGDRATVNYGVEGRPYPQRPCVPGAACVPATSVPPRGTFHFRKGRAGWAPMSHEFHE